MQRENIGTDLKDVSFEFFYWFSRFEFALKENKYLKSEKAGDKAEPSWAKFCKKFKGSYQPSKEALLLIQLHPKRQIVSTTAGDLEWKPVGVGHCNNDLCRVITMLCTTRNNLFHGGKHGDTDTDSVERNVVLLSNAKEVLSQLAVLGGFEHDFWRLY